MKRNASTSPSPFPPSAASLPIATLPPLARPAALVSALHGAKIALEHALRRGARLLPVLAAGECVGVVSAEDLDAADAGASVLECLASPAVFVEPDATLEEAARLMTRHRVDCLVSRLAGGLAVVSRADLLRAGFQLDDDSSGVCRRSAVSDIAARRDAAGDGARRA